MSYSVSAPGSYKLRHKKEYFKHDTLRLRVSNLRCHLQAEAKHG